MSTNDRLWLKSFTIRVLEGLPATAVVSVLRKTAQLMVNAINPVSQVVWEGYPETMIVIPPGGELTLHSTHPIVFADLFINGSQLKIRVSENAAELAQEEANAHQE
jgi:hypothetical protein